MSDDPFAMILGRSAAAQAIRTFGRRAAAIDAPVLLLGESGTGKGVLARAIHDASARARGAFVAVNCAAVPDALFESEFFGHVRGAFTGAQYAHKGLFEQAHGGTLFLDEVGELPLPAQAKLLTAIEDRLVRRVGGERVSAVNTRIVAATARDLEAAVINGSFRGDLYHRLSVLAFRIPPLRQRSEDIAELAALLLAASADRYQRGHCAFDAGALDRLAAHSWPGNVRELSNVIEAAVVASPSDVISIGDDAFRMKLYPSAHGLRTPLPAAESPADERARIEDALRRCHGNKTRAAASLGIARTTLWLKLKRFPVASDVRSNNRERSENAD
jgi:DNA-binding NtrC family response regulator